MIFPIANALVKLFNIKFETAIKWARRILLGSLILVLLIVSVIVFKTCSGPTKPLITEQERQMINQAIETNNREQMEKIFVEVELKQAAIDANTANAKTETINRIYEARKTVRSMSNEELAAHLESLK